MESFYHQTNKILLETQQCFEKLEKAMGPNVEAIEREIQARIDQITSNCERMEILVNKEPPTRRQNAKFRVDQLKYDNQHLQAALRNIQHVRYQRRQEEEEREELLSRRFSPNSEENTSILIDHSLQQHSSLQNANRGVDNMIMSGAGILESLKDQRLTMKGAHRRMMDIANTLGLSNTTMRLIEKRAYQDKFILLGGMLITLVVIFIVVVYLK